MQDPVSRSFFYEAFIYLAATVAFVPVFKRLGLGSIIGYLTAGIAIGPFGFQLIKSTEEVLHFSEFGVVLLLFLIGLELNSKKLYAMRRSILGTGGLQVLVCILVFTLLGMLGGLRFPFAFVASMGFAMSSTAIALQILKEKNLMKTRAGETTFAVLLFQDLAVIPILALLPLLSLGGAADAGEPGWVATLKSLAAILVVVVGGRYLLRPVFRYIADTKLREVFTAFALFLVLVISMLMQSVGLSLALGTFLAGVLLSESQYRHELESDIEPFKGLLMGLFFISVGMSINFSLLREAPGLIIALALAMIFIKMVLLHLIGRLFKLCDRDGVIFSLVLSQGGEFAFVIFATATAQRILSPEQAGVLTLIVALSMLTTPVLMMIDERWIAPLFAKRGASSKTMAVENENNAVILAGFGRFGQPIGRLLHARGIPTTILDRDANQVDLVQRFGWKAFYGDVSRLDLLHAAGAAQAKLLILAIDDMDAALKTALLTREHFPNMKVIARVTSRPDAYIFISHGIEVFRETMGSALDMGETALRVLGHGAYEAHKSMLHFKYYDTQAVKEAAAHVDDEETLISLSRQWRDELTKLMEGDDKTAKQTFGDNWL